MDVQRVIKIFSAIAAVLAATMLYEKFSHVNLYGFIGSHPIISEIRNGSLRAQGPFHHAILAGFSEPSVAPLLLALEERQIQVSRPNRNVCISGDHYLVRLEYTCVGFFGGGSRDLLLADTRPDADRPLGNRDRNIGLEFCDECAGLVGD